MKNELTPQIAAMYIGQMATITWLVEGDYFERGEQWNTDIKHSVLEWFESGKATIKPRLRPLSSLTESEARELYLEAHGFEFDYALSKFQSAIEWFVSEDFSHSVIGSPAVWLHLLSKGFDLFQGIEAGWAKEIKTDSNLASKGFTQDLYPEYFINI